MRPQKRSSLLLISFTLARWQLRQVWRFLFFVELGILAVILVVCVLPLAWQVTSMDQVYHSLGPYLNNAKLSVSASVFQADPELLEQKTQELNQYAQTTFSVSTQARFTVLSMPFFLEEADHLSQNQLRIAGYDPALLPAHVNLLQGRLPQQSNEALEIALTPESARDLHVSVGSRLSLQVHFGTSAQAYVSLYHLPVLVTAIVQTNSQDPFWQQTTLGTQTSDPGTLNTVVTSAPLIVATFARIEALPAQRGTTLLEPLTISWRYPVDPLRYASMHGLQSIASLTATQPAVAAELTASTRLTYVQVNLNTAYLQVLDRQNQVLQLIIVLLALDVLALLAFFVSVMTRLFLERQAEAIVLLRSRGASERQLFGAYSLLGLSLCLLALLIGPLVALLILSLATRMLFPPAEVAMLQAVVMHPFSQLLSISWFALGASTFSLLTLLLSLRSAIRFNLLTQRRETARTRQKPFWLRLYLDLFTALVALGFYGLLWYVINADILDPQIQTLVASPLALLAPILLLLAALLLFLRFFPVLLHWLSRLAARGRNATGLLALTQIARSPRHTMRLTLLLSVTIALLLFLQVLSASQTARASDLATFEAGADFSGSVTLSTQAQQDDQTRLAELTAPFRQLTGITSVSAGYTGQFVSPGALLLPVAVHAVDSQSFAHAADWLPQNSAQPLAQLMNTLHEASMQAQRGNTALIAIPAIVDDAAWTQLQLAPNKIFFLKGFTLSIAFIATIHVHTISTISDTPLGASAQATTLGGGLLVDYQSMDSFYRNLFGQQAIDLQKIVPAALPMNTIWLRTSDDPGALARIRSALNHGQTLVTDMQDRRALFSQLENGSVQHTLLVLFSFLALVPLALALIGNLLSSWLNVQTRLLSFAILRALGSRPRQIVGILALEQGLVYGIALLLGLGLGTLIALLGVPALVMSDAAARSSTPAQFYIAQSVPAIRLAWPDTFSAWLAGSLLFCALTLAMMIALIARPSLSQTLRLNQD